MEAGRRVICASDFLFLTFGWHACLGGTHGSCHARSRLLIEISSPDLFAGVLKYAWVSNLRLQATV